MQAQFGIFEKFRTTTSVVVGCYNSRVGGGCLGGVCCCGRRVEQGRSESGNVEAVR